MIEHTLLRPMVHSDLEPVLAWRNAPDVRRFMYTQHQITRAEHQAWFTRMQESETDHLLVLEVQGVPLGFLRFNVESPEARRAQWGFYRSPSAPKGTGRRLCEAALTYAFEELGLHKVYGEALELNEPSQLLHRRLGFTEEARLRDHFFDGECYWDSVGFGLLAAEWNPRKDV